MKKTTIVPAMLALFSLVVVPVALAASPQQPLPTTPLTEAALNRLNLKLAEAVARGNLKLTRALLSQGADPNTLVTKYGGGLLHLAAAEGKMDLVRALLDRGANAVMRNTDLQTPSELARKRGHTAVADLLKKAEDGDYIPLSLVPPTPPPAPKITIPPAVKKTQAQIEAARKKLKDYNYVKQNFGRL